MFRSTTVLALASTLVLAGTLAAATNKPKKSAEPQVELYNAGVALLGKGDLEGARDKFKAALDEKEDFAEAHNNLGYTLRKLGSENYEKALEHYNRALEIDPELAEAYHYRGVLHVLIGEEEAAKADHAKLLELDRELAEELMTVIASGEEPEGMAGASDKW